MSVSDPLIDAVSIVLGRCRVSSMLHFVPMIQRKYRTGDYVSVRSAEEILATLEADGTLEGLPFMPEMVEWCGKRFRVQRQVEKTCVDGYRQRQFPGQQVVILDSPRCDGSRHDGCGHGCRIFWKEAWLRPADAAAESVAQSASGLEALKARLKVKADAQRYFCQSTELFKATRAFPGAQKPWVLRILLREIRTGDLPLGAAAKTAYLSLSQKVRRRAGGDRWLHGPHTRTPNESLGLQPGELVRVKSRAEIAQTLDRHGRNRGMGICSEMTRCCGGEARVRCRVDRLIDETTGIMREMTDTVTLENISNDASLAEECLCYGVLGDCPRGEIMYWREIWLERMQRAGQ